MARSNDQYGLPRWQYATGASKAKTIEVEQLIRVTDPHVRLSLELQQAFGLRREETIKIQPSLADKGALLWLKPSWTKGGREREIPIRTDEQREILDRARRLAGTGSLIPSHKNYIQQRRLYEGQCIRAGLSRMHGLRHAYAQQRFNELAGFKSPVAGGPAWKTLTEDQRALDKKVLAVISNELGHNREAITVVYLGK